MLLVIAILLAVLWLPSPLGWIVVAVAAVAEIGETFFWYWYTTRRRALVGVETLLGRRGVVTSPCFPAGQVRLAGELWEARCARGAGTGAEVVVVGREDLVLVVEPVEGALSESDD